MALIATDVCRYAFNGTYQGRPCVNVLDMVVHATPGTTVTDRADGINQLAVILLDNFVTKILGNNSSAYSFESVSWVDLDSSSGSTGIITSTPDHTLPIVGGAAGAPYGANSAALITKETTSARGQRQGRWFLPAVTEANCTGNLLDTGTMSDFATALGDWNPAITQTALLADLQYFPCVVHTKNVGTPTDPVIEYEGNSQIHTWAAQRQIASQRRRNRP